MEDTEFTLEVHGKDPDTVVFVAAAGGNIEMAAWVTRGHIGFTLLPTQARALIVALQTKLAEIDECVEWRA